MHCKDNINFSLTKFFCTFFHKKLTKRAKSGELKAKIQYLGSSFIKIEGSRTGTLLNPRNHDFIIIWLSEVSFPPE